MPYKPKPGSIMAAPNVIPMADIMLVLLIIMMVVTPMLQKGVQVDMARAKNWENMPNADKGDAKKVVDAVRDAGVDNLGLLTLKNETGPNQPPPPPPGSVNPGTP